MGTAHTTVRPQHVKTVDAQHKYASVGIVIDERSIAMANPFKYLYDKRKAKEDEKLRQQEAERQAREREEQLRQARRKAAEQFDGMVTKVLQQLQEAAYPDGQLRYNGAGVWSIGHEYWRETGDRSGERAWASRVSVTLIYDERNMPAGFECERSGGYHSKTRLGEKFVQFGSIRCKLSETELIKTLQQLHPVEAVE